MLKNDLVAVIKTDFNLKGLPFVRMQPGKEDFFETLLKVHGIKFVSSYRNAPSNRNGHTSLFPVSTIKP